MKKIVMILLGIIFVIITGIFIIGKFMPEEESEDILVYEGSGETENTVDLVVQGPNQILYLQKIKLIMDHPTVGDVIQAVISSGEGVDIKLGENGEIVKIADYLSGESGQWGILIDNEKIKETNVWEIPVEEYQGITFLFE